MHGLQNATTIGCYTMQRGRLTNNLGHATLAHIVPLKFGASISNAFNCL